jgi:YD repeat-containing protein
MDFRQVSASNVFESGDSSYSQITTSGATNPYDPVEDITLTLRSTDGTTMAYSWQYGAYRCTKITDRNGNYIAVTYDGAGRLATVTDTLGRVLTINDTDGTPTSITQTWRGTNGSGSTTTHTWATFSYTTKTVDTDWDSSIPGIVGPPDGTAVTVLDKITYADGSFTKFDYNGYIQVKKVSNIAADSTSHVLNYVEPNLASPSSGQTDCPRFTSTNNWAERFNVIGSTATAVTVTNTAPATSSFTGPNGSETTSVVKVGITGDPDNHYTRVHYGPSSYKEGLTLATEDCTDTGSSCGTRVRWTWNSLTQDNTGLAYILNPRVTESRVGDGTNTKRTTIGYGSNGYGLPELVKVYDTDLTTVLKTQKTTYDLSSNYTDRRIIGLPSESDLYEGTDTGGTLMSKVTYGFDESGYTGIGQSVSPGVGHDNTNFGTGLTFRANATSTLRWDVTTPTTSGNAVTSSVKYNTAGLPISATDPRGRVTSVSYTDNWNDSTSRTTYAYPTTITDPNSNSSTIKYRFDIGANVEANSPAPAGQSYGKTSKRVFDSVGRLERNSIYVNTTEKAYTRYEYPTNGVESQSYTPLVDVDGDGNIAEDEVLTDTWFDGAGRVIGARTEHPGSSGGWSAVLTDYDILGRVSRRSVPTEINTSWVAYGDDSARGFIYDYSYYDWKGRTVRTVPSDSTGSDGKDTLFSYAGCGCAGGQVTTVSGPVTTAVDVSGTTQTTKRRTQKSYEDILGRDFKTELWDLDGGSAPYSTTKATFNGRDQATLIREYDGPESSTTYQDTTMTYDGHGRVYQSHKPEQSGDYWSSGTHTTYSYNADDSIHTVTDARGVVTSYTYGHADDGSSSEYRKFLTKIAYTVPSDGSGIADPADVAYSYDTAGNRTSMTDGHGSMAYSYNSLSQMTDETRTFNDYLNYAPISDHGFEIQYTYTLTGALKSLTDPFGKEIDYTHDKAGRLSTVAGTTSVDGITTFANNPSYRAWGGLSHFEYGNGDYMNQSFNSKLAPTHFELRYSDTTTAMDKDLSYYNDGSPSYSQDHKNAHFDRLNKYDFAGRPVSAKTDEEARGNTQTTLSAMPYRQSYEYDAFSNITQRNNKQWGDDADPVSSASYNLTHTYSNNRVTNTGFSYDADGRQIASASPDPLSYTDYDAAGRAISQDNVTLSYDGDGAETVRYSANSVGADTDETATYFLRSSVLGGRTITEYSKTDYTDWSTSDTTTTFRYKSYVYAGGSEIAYKIHSLTYNSDKVLFEHSDPSGMSYKTTGPAGTINGAGKVRIEGSPAEMDGLNNNVGTLKPSSPETPTVPYHHIFNDSPMAVNPLQMCPTLDGMDAPCGQVHFLARVGGLQIELSDGHGHTGHADVEERLGHLFTRISVSQRGRWDGPDDFVPTPGSEPISTFGFIDLDWSGNGGGGRGGPNVGDDPVYTKQMQDCDSLLARLFGGKGAVAAGNDFEPEGMGGPGQKYRGPTEKAPTEGEFTNMMHLYGSSNGKEYTNVYVPPNPSATYANPRAYPGDVGGSYVFYYKSLTLPNGGRLTDVSLVVSHIKDYGFDSSSTNSSKYVLIGQVGGPGGDSGGMNPYRHVHMTLVAGRVKGSKALSSMKRIGFAKTFCN